MSHTDGCEFCPPHWTQHPLRAAMVLRPGISHWFNPANPTLNAECQAGIQWLPFLQFLGRGLNPWPTILRADTLPLDHWAGQWKPNTSSGSTRNRNTPATSRCALSQHYAKRLHIGLLTPCVHYHKRTGTDGNTVDASTPAIPKDLLSLSLQTSTAPAQCRSVVKTFK